MLCTLQSSGMPSRTLHFATLCPFQVDLQFTACRDRKKGSSLHSMIYKNELDFDQFLSTIIYSLVETCSDAEYKLLIYNVKIFNSHSDFVNCNIISIMVSICYSQKFPRTN